MQTSLAIGDFARATHMSVKTLRYYHRVGLLEPVDVDPRTGYRRYSTDQIPTAHIIRRFRQLDMPVHDVQAVLAATDPDTRNALIAAHLSRLEEGLTRTQNAVASLRDLLEAPTAAELTGAGRRRVEATQAAAIIEVVDVGDVSTWLQGALGELYATLAAQNVVPAGPAGGIFDNDLFTHERGQATMFVPTVGTVREMGRLTSLVVPAVDLAVVEHVGPHKNSIDRAYGALATYVTHHAIAIEGPIREYYLTDRHNTLDESQWVTEIGWPIFDTGNA
jgi:DNA-binding transcriptional MerR regulator